MNNYVVTYVYVDTPLSSLELIAHRPPLCNTPAHVGYNDYDDSTPDMSLCWAQADLLEFGHGSCPAMLGHGLVT